MGSCIIISAVFFSWLDEVIWICLGNGCASNDATVNINQLVSTGSNFFGEKIGQSTTLASTHTHRVFGFDVVDVEIRYIIRWLCAKCESSPIGQVLRKSRVLNDFVRTSSCLVVVVRAVRESVTRETQRDSPARLNRPWNHSRRHRRRHLPLLDILNNNNTFFFFYFFYSPRIVSSTRRPAALYIHLDNTPTCFIDSTVCPSVTEESEHLAWPDRILNKYYRKTRETFGPRQSFQDEAERD